jgi:hypothetical protein
MENNFSPTGSSFHQPLFTRQFSPLHQLFTTAQTFHPLKHLYTSENTCGKFKKHERKASSRRSTKGHMWITTSSNSTVPEHKNFTPPALVPSMAFDLNIPPSEDEGDDPLGGFHADAYADGAPFVHNNMAGYRSG